MSQATDYEIEKSKYDRIWTHPDYHLWSPGENAVDVFMNLVKPPLGDSVIDLGCGTGRAARALRARGLNPVMLDFTNMGLEVFDIPFIEANLWDVHYCQYDWIFCVDVLEHIPTPHVDATLDGMARMTRKGGFLQIALFEDGCGRAIGERLHMTVESPEWWWHKIMARWQGTMLSDANDSRGIHGYAKFVLGAPREAYVT